jgi:tryptophan-rich hypothetical protein
MALPPRFARLVGSKFTSQVPREGWTHFHVVGVQRLEQGWQAELAASCDAGRRVRVSTGELFDRDHWRPGWTPLSER